MAELCVIVAMGENRVIGSSGKILWHLPADFKHFKELTMGHPIIMGRKTFVSIGRPLPGRMNIVITRDPAYAADGVLAAHSLDEALRLAGNDDEANNAQKIFIIGGEEIYAMALAKADIVYVTKVHGTFDGDAFFPELPEAEWRLASSESHVKDEKNAFDFDFLVYDRVAGYTRGK